MDSNKSEIKPVPQSGASEAVPETTAAAHERMDPELKQKWLVALRSGEYQQVRAMLHDEDKGYCCLGVLCTLIPGVYFTTDDACYVDEYGETYDAHGELPMPVRHIARIPRETVTRLVAMNDGRRDMPAHSFSEIADYIEANL